MKKREITILVLLILAALAYLLLRSNGKSSWDLPEWKSPEKGDIQSLEYRGGGENFSLVLEGDGWTLPDGNRADSGKMDRILTALSEFSLLDKLSSKDSYSTYGLDDDSARTLVIHTGEGEKTIVFGKSAPGGGSYVRLPGIKGVYSVNRNLGSLIPSSPSDLRDKTVLAVNKESVTSVSLSRGDQRLSFRKIEDQWVEEGKGGLDQDALQTKVDGLGSLKCSSFLDTLPEGPGNLEIRIDDGSLHTLTVYDKTDTGYTAVSSDSSDAFVLSGYIVDGWTGLLEDQS